MIKKALATAGIAGFLGTAGVAFAQAPQQMIITHDPVPLTTASSTPHAQPMVLEIGPRGKVLLRGTIESVSADSLTVKGWGGIWTVNVPTTSKILPNGVSLSNFQQGDFVGIEGTVDQSSSWTVSAELVRDWTERKAAHQEAKQNIQSVRGDVRAGAGTSRVIQGTVSGLDTASNTFTLTTEKGASYSVSLASGAKTLQRNWLSLDFSTAQNGDKVRVWGPVASSTISASVFRDLSVPRR